MPAAENRPFPSLARIAAPVAVLVAVLVVAAIVGGCARSVEIAPADREVASIEDVPLQTEDFETAPIERDGVLLRPRASYEISARLLARERYRLDALASVVPVDFALAWGPAAAEAVQAELRISQGNRWFYWRTRGSELPLPRRELVAGMANVHIVPADDAIREAVLAFDGGECVWLRGQLVDIDGRGDAALSRRTSMTRTDTGGGSCEILLVEQVAQVECE